MPVGSCQTSVLSLVPNLQHAGAPEMKYQQGDHDTCVFSLLALVLYYTGISRLKEIANDLHQRSKKLSGGVHSLHLVKKIHKERASWLGCKKLKPTFDWEKDLEVNMILMGVIEDSEGSCQHAVIIFCKWVFNSNEKVALPLCQESLDCCTWEDGKVTTQGLSSSLPGGYFMRMIPKKEKN